MFQRILAAIDGSATSNNALHFALQLARRNDAQVRFVYCMEKLQAELADERRSQSSGEKSSIPSMVLDDACVLAVAAGVRADKHLLQATEGDLGRAIAEEARRWYAELIVLGADGRRAPGPSALGSVSAQVISCAHVPVLAVPIHYLFNAGPGGGH